MSPPGLKARVGGGKSFGSRASKTHTPPAATKSAKRSAPIAASMTDKQRPRVAAAPAPRVGGLSGLLLRELIAVVNAMRGRKRPALAPTRGPAGTPNRSPYIFTNGPAAKVLPLSIGETDFESFERLLGEIQSAYGREDTEELGARTTPEMFSYFSRDMHDNAIQGRRHELADVKLLDGELSEAWSENGSDYATVAMSYSLIETAFDRETGAVISGDPLHSSDVTELWTFRRDDRAREAGWELSAIQQAA